MLHARRKTIVKSLSSLKEDAFWISAGVIRRRGAGRDEFALVKSFDIGEGLLHLFVK